MAIPFDKMPAAILLETYSLSVTETTRRFITKRDTTAAYKQQQKLQREILRRLDQAESAREAVNIFGQLLE